MNVVYRVILFIDPSLYYILVDFVSGPDIILRPFLYFIPFIHV